MPPDPARRITGRHPLIDGPGAAVELEGDVDVVVDRIRAWTAHLRLPIGEPVVRRHATGASLAVRCPPDLPSAAADLLDAAIAGPPPEGEAALLAAFEAEAHPTLRRLLDRAVGPHFFDDDGLTVGTGIHARTWPLDALPDALPEGRGVPTVLLSGTNGKTTTTRMLARIGRAAGLRSGFTSSDAIVVDGEVVERGDWTGPGAARTLLRNPRVEMAVLETARGGLLRRGLVLDGVDGAILVNVSDDHLGEWGLHTVDDLAWAKATLVRAVRPGGWVVVNRGCAPLFRAVERIVGERPDLRVLAFDIEPRDGLVGFLDGDDLVLPGLRIAARDIPASLDGAARHNLENALAAAVGAFALGLPGEAIAGGLAAFSPSVAESRGRANRFRLPSGATAILDFAHNPDGIARVAALVARLEPARLTVLAGSAGDRPDATIVAIGEAIGAMGPARVLLKELPEHLRGRAPGEVPALLRRGLVAAGVPSAALEEVPDELEAARAALDGAGPGDRVLLLVHEQTDAVLALLAERGAVEG